MAELFARYESGLQFTAGAIAGSANGVSGLNPLVDRLNSISQADSTLSGTSLTIHSSQGNFSSVCVIPYKIGSVLPVLNTNGETAIWAPSGVRIYDTYNSSIDPLRWDTTITLPNNSGSAIVSETASFIENNIFIKIDSSGLGYSAEANMRTNNLPELGDMRKIEFRVNKNNVQSVLNGHIDVFGTRIFSGLSNDDSIWRIEKQADNDWFYYDDNILIGSFTPTDNIVQVAGSFSNDTSTKTTVNREMNMKLYQLSIDGGTFLVAFSNGSVYKTLMTLED